MWPGGEPHPPEDVGGSWGYGDFLEAITDPDHDDHEQMLEWVGCDFDPESCADLTAINVLLSATPPKSQRPAHAAKAGRTGK